MIISLLLEPRLIAVIRVRWMDSCHLVDYGLNCLAMLSIGSFGRSSALVDDLDHTTYYYHYVQHLVLGALINL